MNNSNTLSVATSKPPASSTAPLNIRLDVSPSGLSVTRAPSNWNSSPDDGSRHAKPDDSHTSSGPPTPFRRKGRTSEPLGPATPSTPQMIAPAQNTSASGGNIGVGLRSRTTSNPASPQPPVSVPPTRSIEHPLSYEPERASPITFIESLANTSFISSCIPFSSGQIEAHICTWQSQDLSPCLFPDGLVPNSQKLLR
jgi:hypothetical protein